MGIDVQALIAAQKAKLEATEPVTQEVMLGDEVVGVRLWPVTGAVWRNLCAGSAPRADSQFDQRLGYGISGVLRAYPRVHLVQGDAVTDVADAWPDIFDSLDGPDLANLELAIWGLNEFEPSQRLAAAGKASAGSKRKKRS